MISKANSVRTFLIISSCINALVSSYTVPSSRPVRTKNTILQASNNNINDNIVNDNIESSSGSRKAFLRTIGASIVSSTAILNPKAAFSEENDKLTDVYFGVGCFWHIQHEFVEAERNLLKRTDIQLTSKTGYAGGNKVGKDNTVCYHNFSGLSDYGKLGHGEVVGMTLPESSIGDFADVYFSLFGKNGQRVDPLDVGPEYRSLLGLPGGKNHPMYKYVDEAATKSGFTLLDGKGNDPDTLRTKNVYVMDSIKFPYYQAEIYHQYHNDFQSPAYGKAYNKLVNVAYEKGDLKYSVCPDLEI